ncbi:MAG: radical SAM protein [Patescibacteria group bacterium]
MENQVILTSPLPIMIPIIKIVGNYCNCRCGYCFYHENDQSTPRLMDIELLESFIKQYMELFSGGLNFIWHGGEPLLAGIDFFKKIIKFQEENLRDEQIVKNYIQTNGTLISDEWAVFLKANNFRVGVSIDGDRESHNLFRKDKAGKGTFNRVVKGIKVLRRNGIEPGIMKTLTSSNVKRSVNDFNFFLDVLKVKSWSANVYLDLKKENKAMTDQSVSTEELTEFLLNYIDFWLSKDNAVLKIREIENFISGIFEKVAPNCTFNGFCSGYFCLDYGGKIYPCDRFSNNSEYVFGDLSQQSLLEVLNSSKRLKYAECVNFVPDDCTICEWKDACHNGCSSYRIDGVKGKYYYCETRKKVFNYLKEKIDCLGLSSQKGEKNGR